MLKADTIPVADLVARHVRPGRPLLSILHGIQAEAGYLPAGVIAPLALALNLSRAEVHGFITYYPHFHTTPPAAIVIQLCRAEACQSMGAEALAQHIEQRTGCRFAEHGEPAGAAVDLESVYCLGLCALSPALMINQRLHAKVTPQKFDALLACAEQSIEQAGSQIAPKTSQPAQPSAAGEIV